MIGTGLAIAVPVGWVGLVHPRSGLAAKHGITVLNAPGTVDSGYRGEIMVTLLKMVGWSPALHSSNILDSREGVTAESLHDEE